MLIEENDWNNPDNFERRWSDNHDQLVEYGHKVVVPMPKSGSIVQAQRDWCKRNAVTFTWVADSDYGNNRCIIYYFTDVFYANIFMWTWA